MTEATETALECILGGILFCMAVSMLLLLTREVMSEAEKLRYQQGYFLYVDKSPS